MSKKIISGILSFAMAASTIVVPQTISFAESEGEIIISVANAEWTIPDTLDQEKYKVSTIAGKEAGELDIYDETNGVYTDSSDTAQAVTYSQSEKMPDGVCVTYGTEENPLPEGNYEVYYWIPGVNEESVNNNGSSVGRSIAYKDSDITIEDVYGTHTIESIKPSGTFKGYVNLGTYQLDQNSRITASVNKTNDIKGSSFTHKLASVKLKLVPVADYANELLSAINQAGSAAEIGEAIEAYEAAYEAEYNEKYPGTDTDYKMIDGKLCEKVGNNYYGVSASEKLMSDDELINMYGVYSGLLANRPESGYESITALKNKYDELVKEKTTLKKITGDILSYNGTLFRPTTGNLISINNMTSSYAIASFKDIDSNNVKSAEIQLVYRDTVFGAVSDFEMSKYSYSEYTRTNTGALTSGTADYTAAETFANGFEDAADAKRNIFFTSKEIDKSLIKNATNGYFSAYFTINPNYTSGGNEIDLDANAYLTITYDNSKYETLPDVNAKTVNADKVFDLAGFTSIDSVTVNGEAIAEDKYSLKNERALIDGNVFNEVKTYEITFKSGATEVFYNVQTVGAQEIAVQKANIIHDIGEVTDDNKLRDPDSVFAFPYVFVNKADWTYDRNQVNAKITGIPAGKYDVEYYVPYSTSNLGMNMTMLDVDLEIKDANGTYVKEAIMPSYAGGYEICKDCEGYIGDGSASQYVFYDEASKYVKVGTYEFDGENDSVLIYANDENKTKSNNAFNRHTFVPGKIRLTPVSNEAQVHYYYQTGKNIMEDLNNADSAEELRSFAENNLSSLIDINSLNNMSGVWEGLYSNRPSAGYASEAAFKAAFDNEVSKYLKTVRYEHGNTKLTTKPNGDNTRIKVIDTYETDHMPSESVKFVIFNDIAAGSIKNISLDIAFNDNDSANNKYAYIHNMIVDRYSLDDFELEVNEALDGVAINTMEHRYVDRYRRYHFTDVPAAMIKASASELSNDIANAMNSSNKKTTDLVLGLVPDYTLHKSIYSNNIKDADLIVTYDTTVADNVFEAAKAAARAETIAAAEKIVAAKTDVFGITQSEVSRYALAFYGESIEAQSDYDEILAKLSYDKMLSNSQISYEDNTIEGTIKLKNLSGAADEPTVTVAVYKNGLLKGMTFAQKSADDDRIAEYSFNVNAANADSIKLFAFNSMSAVKPMAMSYEYQPVDDTKTYAADYLLNAGNEVNTDYSGGLTIAYIGGSLTAGDSDLNGSSITDSSNAWPRRMTDYVKSKYPKVDAANVKLINAAMGGAGSVFGSRHFERDVLAYNPDIIFIEHTVNDCADLYLPNHYTGFETELNMALNHDKVPVIIYVHTIMPVEESHEKYTRYMNAKVAKEDITARYGIKVLDIMTAVKEMYAASGSSKTFTEWLADEGYYPITSQDPFMVDVHPNPKGYELYAQLMQAEIEKDGFAACITKLRSPQTSVVGDKFGSIYNDYLKQTFKAISASDTDRIKFNGDWTLYTMENPYKTEDIPQELRSLHLGSMDREVILGDGIMQSLDADGCSFEFTTDANEIYLSCSFENVGKDAYVYIKPAGAPDSEYVQKGNKYSTYYQNLSRVEGTSSAIKISDNGGSYDVKVVIEDTDTANNKRVYRLKYIRECYYNN